MKATVLYGDCGSVLDRQNPDFEHVDLTFLDPPSIKIRGTTSGTITCLKRNIGSGWVRYAQRFIARPLRVAQSILCSERRKLSLCYGVCANLDGCFKTLLYGKRKRLLSRYEAVW